MKQIGNTLTLVSELFSDYRASGPAFDEMISDEGVRAAYSAALRQLGKLEPDEVRSRADYLKSSYLDQGVTFDIGGEERPFPLDIVPRILMTDEWAVIEAGVAQRVRALEAFLADVYSYGKVFDDGVIPRRVVASSPHFHRVMHGVTPIRPIDPSRPGHRDVLVLTFRKT